MGTMAVGRIIVLSALIAQTLSAPSGCIETCNYYQTSLQSRQSSTGHQGHTNLLQGGATLDERDYTRPGNWTERNQYNTDEGHGKVQEERGQYVEGAKKVRYYKKNFTSSYGTSNVNGAGATEFGSQTSDRHDVNQLIPSNQRPESLNTYDQLGATSVTGESGYNRVHGQRTQSSSSSSSRYDSVRNERLEDFGEHGGYSQVDRRVPVGDVRTTSDRTRYHNVETAPGNWSRADSYRTDGGHRRVFEEEGQYTTGPKKVRYYRKNYTSSYGTPGVPQTDVDTTRLQDLHNELQQNLHKQLDSFRRDFHQSSSTGHATNVGAAHSLTQETVGLHDEDLQTAETDAYKHVPSQQSTGSVHRYTADQQHRETFADTRQHMPYVYPSAAADTYGTENQRTYQSHETYVSRMHPTPGPTPRLSTGYIQLPAPSGGYQASVHNAHYGTHERHMAEQIQQAEIAAARQSSLAQNQLFTENSRHASYHQPNNGAHHPDSRRGHTTHYEEQWSSSSSSHGDGNLTPERGSATFAHGADAHDRSHYDRDAYNEQRGRYHSATHGHNSRVHISERNYDPAYTTTTGQLVTGTQDLRQAAQSAADCTEETQQYQQETRYHRKYKRDEDNARRTAEQEDLTQQNQKFDQESQQLEGTELLQMPQASDPFAQQNAGQLEFGQQTVGDQHLEDLTQQSEQLTQQTEGQLEFGQQTVGHQHLDNLTQQSEQLTQQTEGQLEFGQQTVGHQHLEDLTQQSEQLTQQTEGQLEFGHRSVGNKHLEDLTQQTEGQFEFGHQSVGNKHLEDLTQQTEGQLEFGHQTVGNKHLEDLTQQTEGQLEFGQQTVGNKHLEDLTQQTEGQLEFGQQTIGNKHLEDLTQQMEAQLEFGHQTVDNKHLEDLTQQTEGQIEFGQHSAGHQQMEDLTQQIQQYEQQKTGESDDFTQQTAGHLEYGQQRERQMSNRQKYNGHLESLPQRNDWNTDDLSQQSYQYPSFNTGDSKMSEWQSEKNHFDHDFPQQTDDQQSMTTGMAKPAAKPKPRQRYPKHDSLPSHIDETDTRLDDVFKPIEVNPEADIDNLDEGSMQHRDHATYPKLDSKMEDLQSRGSGGFVEGDNMDRLHWLHKSNDATVGLQWHYTYHPSDLTNIESSHDSYYSRHNVNPMSQQTGNEDEQQQQSKPFDYDQQETRGDRAFDNTYQQSVSQSSQTRHNAYDQQSGSFQQVETPRFDRQSEQNSEDAPSRVIPLQSGRDSQQASQLDQQPTQPAGQIESRILEAYGGGPYDASRDDEVYRRVKPNPSATLPPIGGEDPWDIREKPREIIPWSVANRLSTTSSTPRVTNARMAEATETTRQIIAETTMQTVETITTEEAPPSFWSRLGHKITSTYDKAKDKAKEYFG